MEASRRAKTEKSTSSSVKCKGFCYEFLAKNKTVIMHQPTYSPDLAPAEFFLFPKLKTPMKGKRFATIEEIKEKYWKQELLAIPKGSFQKCFEDLNNAGISVLYLRGGIILKATR